MHDQDGALDQIAMIYWNLALKLVKVLQQLSKADQHQISAIRILLKNPANRKEVWTP